LRLTVPSSQNRLAVQLKNYGLKYDDIRNEAEPDHEGAIAVCIHALISSVLFRFFVAAFLLHAIVLFG
jgi:hypothetical protein